MKKLLNKTYCINSSCPFKKCDKHVWQLRNIKDKTQKISVAAFDGVCEKYLTYVLKEHLNNEN